MAFIGLSPSQQYALALFLPTAASLHSVAHDYDTRAHLEDIAYLCREKYLAFKPPGQIVLTDRGREVLALIVLRSAVESDPSLKSLEKS